jgi:outer membrane receptor protein involved in Fe transport
MNDQTIRITPLAAAITAVLYPVQAAIAQEYEDPVLEEVIVTATLRETNLQVVPQSITAFSNADIVRNNLQTLEDIVSALPSLNMVSSQPSQVNLIMRGVTSNAWEYYLDSQVSVYLDDTSIAAPSQQPFPYMVDIERVENLPGPQGTLFGSASQTGTIRVITNKPNTDGTSGGFFAEVATTKGGDPSYELNGWINFTITEGLALRAVAYRVDQGGYIDNVYQETFAGPLEDGPQFKPNNEDVVEKNFNQYTLTGGRVAALWELSEDLNVTLAVISEDKSDDGTWASDPALGDFEIARFFDEYRDDNWTNVSMTINADMGFASFLSATSIFDREIKYEWDRMAYQQHLHGYFAGYLNTYYGYEPCTWYVLYCQQYTFGTTFNDQTQKRFSQEFRLTSQSDSRFQWMAGLYYEDLEDEWYYGASNQYLMDTPAWDYAQYWAYYYNYYGYPVGYPMAPSNVGYSETLDRQTEQTAIFGELSYEFNERWRVVGGARWFEYDRYNFIKNQFPEGLPPWGTMATDGATLGEGKTSDILWKGSVQYQLSDNKMLYFLYSEGFRLGGFNSPRAISTGLVEPEYDPDKLFNYEFGLKSKWLDDRLLLNATFFHMTWEKYQQSWGDIDGNWWLRGTFNAADAETTGIELNTTFLFTQDLSFDFNIFYADPQWAEDYTFPWQSEGSEPDIKKGTPMPSSPQWKGWAALHWTIPGLFGTEEAWFNYNISFQDETWNNLWNMIDYYNGEPKEGVVPSWNYSNVQFGVRLQNDWTINLVVRNIWDQKAMMWLSTGDNYISDFFGADWNRDIRSYNRPRTIGLQVRKNWE